MASKIELELQKATGIKPKAKEKVQDYLKRLLGATSELDDPTFKELSVPAQKWANTATTLFDKDKDLPEFEADAEPKAKAKAAPAADEDEEDDASAADAEDETAADEPEGEGEEDKTVSTKTKKKAAAKPAAKAPAKKAAAAKEEAPAKKKSASPAKSQGGVQAVLAHVLKSPDDSVADIIAAVKKQGITVTPSTVSSARGFFKLVVRFLQDKKLTTKKLFD